MSPRVQLDECGCVGDDKFQLCLSMVPPMLKMGWETDQVFSTEGTREYWQCKLKPYLETAVAIQTDLTISDHYSNSILFEID